FLNYASAEDLGPQERELDPLRITLAKIFPTGQRLLDLELARLAAMLAPTNESLLGKGLSRITPESYPLDDLHYLLVAARLPVTPDPGQREAIARALLDLDRKLPLYSLHKDTNWNARVGELFAALVARDAGLPARIIADPGFGRPGHVLYMSKVDKQQLGAAVDAFVKAVKT